MNENSEELEASSTFDEETYEIVRKGLCKTPSVQRDLFPSGKSMSEVLRMKFGCWIVRILCLMSEIEKRNRETMEFRNLSIKIPFRVIVRILSYCNIDLMPENLLSMYARFKLDYTKKIFRVFSSSNFSNLFPTITNKFYTMNILELKNFNQRGYDSVKQLKVRNLNLSNQQNCDIGRRFQNIISLDVGQLNNTTDPENELSKVFPDLERLSFSYDSRVSEVKIHDMKNLKVLVISGWFSGITKNYVISLLSECQQLRNVTLQSFREPINEPDIYLFLSLGYNLERFRLMNIRCKNWKLLIHHSPKKSYRMKSFSFSQFDLHQNDDVVSLGGLFRFIGNNYQDTLVEFNLDSYLETDDDDDEPINLISRTDLLPLSKLVSLQNLFIKVSQVDGFNNNNNNNPIDLSFCRSSLRVFHFHSDSHIFEHMFRFSDPESFVCLRKLIFGRKHLDGRMNMTSETAKSITSLPNLENLRFNITLSCKTWHHFFCMKNLRSLVLSELCSSCIDIPFSCTISENSRLRKIRIFKPAENFPERMIAEIAVKCAQLEVLEFNSSTISDPKIEDYFHKIVIPNVHFLPKLREIRCQKYGEIASHTNMTRTHEYFPGFGSLIMNQFEVFCCFKIMERRIRSTLQENDENEETSERSVLDIIKLMNRFSTLFERNKVKSNMRLAMNQKGINEIEEIITKIRYSAFCLLPKDIICTILNEYYELKITHEDPPLYGYGNDLVTLFFGYFRSDPNRSAIRIFSNIYTTNPSKIFNSSLCNFLSFKSIRVNLSLFIECDIFSRPFGVPNSLEIEHGTTRMKNEDDLIFRKLYRCFADLEGIVLRKVCVEENFFSEILRHSKRLRHLELRECQIGDSEWIELSNCSDNWKDLQVLRIVEASMEGGQGIEPKIRKMLEQKYPVVFYNRSFVTI